MKNIKLVLLPLVLVVSFFVSCSTSSVPLEILVPAEISITKEIKHIGIINRTIPARRRKVINFLEGFVTGEQIFADREGADKCINGLAGKLNDSPRFTSVIIRGERLRGTGTRRFARQLNWSTVRNICNKYRVDALIVLETFDSNISIDVERKLKKKKIKIKGTDKKKKVLVPKYYADLYIDVNSGWRIYDPATSSIVDMNTFRDRKAWSSTGKTKRKALYRLPTKREAINVSGFNSGIQYGIRISPTWINVYRDFYVKGDPGLEEAKRYVKADDWSGATRIWKSLLKHDDPKIAGRAAYNLAFAAELKGKFDRAYKWAQMSYTKFGNRKAFTYMRKLESRMSDKERLKEQLD